MHLCILLISTDALAAEFLGGKGSFKVVKKKKKKSYCSAELQYHLGIFLLHVENPNHTGWCDIRIYLIWLKYL